MFIEKTSTAPSPLSFTFPAAWTYAGPTPSALPTFNFVYTGFSAKSGVFVAATILWNGSFGYNLFQVSATANYQNGSTSLAFPDLSSLTGFPPAVASGTQVQWSAAIAQSSSGPEQTLPANGGTLTAVENNGTYMVP